MEAPVLRLGVIWETVKWAFLADLMFQSPHVEYYIPLTVLTRLLDHTLYGDWAGGHHMTSVLLHWLNSVLVLVFLYKATGKYWLSIFFSCVFAWHPMQVEVASWLAARKDVLCGTFALLTLISYLSYARRQDFKRYFLVNILFMAGLLAKPMLVTLPFVLLLLDYWPLRRWRIILPRDANKETDKESGLLSGGTHARLLLEKLPLFIMVVFASLVTWLSQQGHGAIRSLDRYPVSYRFANAISDYTEYLGKLVWPVNLSIVYELPAEIQSWLPVVATTLLLAAITALCLWQYSRRPSLIIGWCWYAGSLLPVTGLVQIGDGALADRYTYLAFLGLYLGAIPVLAEVGGRIASHDPPARFFSKGPVRVIAGLATSCILLGGCILLSREQAATWRNSITLFEHAVRVSPGSASAHLLLGTSYLQKSRFDEAVHHFRESLRLKPHAFVTLYNLGIANERQGDFAEALKAFREARKLSPQNPNAILASIRVLVSLEHREEAAAELAYAEEHLEANPDILQQLAAFHLAIGARERARKMLLQAKTYAPLNASAMNLLALTYSEEQASEPVLKETIARFPKDARAYLALSKLYLRSGRTQEATATMEAGVGRVWNREQLQLHLERIGLRQDPATSK